MVNNINKIIKLNQLIILFFKIPIVLLLKTMHFKFFYRFGNIRLNKNNYIVETNHSTKFH